MSQTERGGVGYTKADAGYFEKRHLQRYAGIWSLWALGVGAVVSGHFYILQAISFILLRKNPPDIERPYRSPLGIPGAVVAIIIGLVTLCHQIWDPNFSKGVVWVGVWFVLAIIYFALIGRHKLILSPEEEFAMEHRAKA